MRTPIADDPLRGSRHLFRRLTARRAPDHLPGEAPSRILVGGAADEAALRDLVAGTLGLGRPESTMVVGGLGLEIGRNEHAGAGDTGRWPLAVVLRPVEPVPHGAYVQAVASLLEGLRRGGLTAAALCAFADELPRNGGRQGRSARTV